MTRGARQNSTGGEGERRREKRATPKKRRGVCWGQPVLMTADHVDSEDECQDVERYDVLCGASLDDDPEVLNPKLRESMRTKRLRATVPFDKQRSALQHAEGVTASHSEQHDQAPTAASLKLAAKKLKRAEAAAGKIRMSTAVPSLAEFVTEDDAKAASKHTDSPTAAAAPALVNLPQAIRQYMASQGFSEPTAVQTQVWEAAARGVDVLAQSPPGSGKTLAFLLPIASALVENGHGRNTRPPSPLSLIISPTHELAQQIQHAAAPLQQLFGLRCTCVHGGASREEQILALQQKPHLLVATPGRLLDLLDTQDLSLSQIEALTLDECDKMLSLGFADQLSRIRTLLLEPPSSGGAAGGDVATGALHHDMEMKEQPSAEGIPEEQHEEEESTKKSKKRRKRQEGDMALVPIAPVVPFRRPQVLLVSATMPAAALQVAEGWLSPTAVHMHVMHAGSDLISPTIIQVVHVCAEHKKQAKLLKHLHSLNAAHASARHAPRVLVFANTTKAVNNLASALSAAQFKVTSLHGKRSQQERTSALNNFKSGKVQMLVATDVAARGLHIPRLPYIVNFDFPGNLETYIHRVGRTGRLEAHGQVFSFMTRNLAPLAPDLVDLLTRCNQPVDPNLLKLKEAAIIIKSKLQDQPASSPLADPASGPPPPPPTDGARETAHIKTERDRHGSTRVQEDADADMLAVPDSGKGKNSIVRGQGSGSAVKEAGQGGKVRDSSGSGSKHSKAAHASPETGMLGDVVGTERVPVKERKMKHKNSGCCSVDTGASEERSGTRSLPVSKGVQENEDKVGVPEKQRKKRRSRADKRAGAVDGAATRKKSKQGILGVPKTDELAGVAYNSGQDSD